MTVWEYFDDFETTPELCERHRCQVLARERIIVSSVELSAPDLEVST